MAVNATSVYLDDVSEVFPVDVIVSFDEDLSQDGFSDGVVFGVELVEAMERVSVLRRKLDVSHMCWNDGKCLCVSGSHRVHVERVHAEVIRRQVHVLEHLHERLSSSALHVHDLIRILLHRSLDEPQQMLLIHAGRRVDVSVHLTHKRSVNAQ